MTRRHRNRRPAPTVFVSDNIVATTGPRSEAYEARPMAKLPAKRAGKHRWIVAASWTASEAMLAKLGPGARQFMDHENLLSINIGCWDCEQALGDASNGGVELGSNCPGDPNGAEW